MAMDTINDEELYKDLYSQLIEKKQSKEQIYDPFKTPPDIQFAITHSKAKMVKQINFTSLEVCPCCNFPTDSTSLPLCCNIRSFSYLGCGYPFYFTFSIACLILIFLFLFFGGTINLIIVNQNCQIEEDNCVKLFKFGILNFGNLRSQVNDQSWNNIVVSLVILAVIFYMKPKLWDYMKSYNEDVKSISSYTIMVRNLPLNTSKDDLARYFNKFQSKVVKINFAFEIDVYMNMFNKKLKLASLLHKNYLKRQKNNQGKLQQNGNFEQNAQTNELIKEDLILRKEYNELSFKIQEFEKECNNTNNSQPFKHFIGTAFVTLENEILCNVLLEEYGVTYFRNIKELFLSNYFTPYLKFRGQTLIINHAPDPHDVIWENLRYSKCRMFINYVAMFFLSLLILSLSFRIQWYVCEKVYSYRLNAIKQINQGVNSPLLKINALLVSMFMVITNFLLRITVYYFTVYQKLFSNTKQNQNYILIYIFLVVFNSALMPYLVNSFIQEYTSEQLIWDIHLILFSNAFSTPFAKIFDPFIYLKIIVQKYIRKKGSSCTYPQQWVNDWFEGIPFDIAENYSYVVRVLYITTWYASVAPIGVIFCIIGLLFNYWLDKYFLLRVTNFPPNQNEEIIKKIVNNLEFLPYIYIFGAIEYNYRIVASDNLFTNIYAFIGYGVSIFSMFFCLVIYTIFYKPRNIPTRKPSEMPYNSAKHMFLTEYDRVNPLTSKQATKDWINYLSQNEDNISEIDRKSMIAIAQFNHGKGINLNKQNTSQFLNFESISQNDTSYLTEKEQCYVVFKKPSIELQMINNNKQQQQFQQK